MPLPFHIRQKCIHMYIYVCTFISAYIYKHKYTLSGYLCAKNEICLPLLCSNMLLSPRETRQYSISPPGGKLDTPLPPPSLFEFPPQDAPFVSLRLNVGDTSCLLEAVSAFLYGGGLTTQLKPHWAATPATKSVLFLVPALLGVRRDRTPVRINAEPLQMQLRRPGCPSNPEQD